MAIFTSPRRSDPEHPSPTSFCYTPPLDTMPYACYTDMSLAASADPRRIRRRVLTLVVADLNELIPADERSATIQIGPATFWLVGFPVINSTGYSCRPSPACRRGHRSFCWICCSSTMVGQVCVWPCSVSAVGGRRLCRRVPGGQRHRRAARAGARSRRVVTWLSSPTGVERQHGRSSGSSDRSPTGCCRRPA